LLELSAWSARVPTGATMKSLDFEKVSVADARKSLDGPLKESVPPATRVRHKSARPRSCSSRRHLARGLPYAVRPIELASRFPRIANSIAELWRRVARCEEYLDSLLVDHRGDRTGFPAASRRSSRHCEATTRSCTQ
jgi:hypothetical protein